MTKPIVFVLRMSLLLSTGLDISPAWAKSLTDALKAGYVDIRSGEAYPGENTDLFATLAYLQPGIVNNLVYNWNGVTSDGLLQSGHYLRRVRDFLPEGLFIASLFETVRRDYSIDLTCRTGLIHADYESLRGADFDNTRAWIDLSRSSSIDFFVCLGSVYIDQGFQIINIQQGDGLVAHANDKTRAQANLRILQTRLDQYAKGKGLVLYWQGEPGMLDYMHLDIVMVPARFFINDFDLAYRNRISRPGVGVGYSYSLSEKRVQDVNAIVSGRAVTVFVVDNFDETQDDLRRFMELDSENRKYLIISSAQTALANGSLFAAPLDHCPGCINVSYVKDPCELLSKTVSEYNAVRCNDLQAIRFALTLTSRKVNDAKEIPRSNP